MTKGAGGIEGAAIFNSTFGNTVGVLITPLWFIALNGSSPTKIGISTLETVLLNSFLTILLPLLVGQLVLHFAEKCTKKIREKVNFGIINHVILLLVIFCAFCDTFSQREMPINPASLSLIISITVILHFIFLGLAFAVGSAKFRGAIFKRPERVTILICSTQKTISVGISLITIIYGGDPTIGLKLLPLLVYHPLQIVFASLIAGKLKAWAKEEKTITANLSSKSRIDVIKPIKSESS